ncbi:MAG: glutamate ligase domain-containing protein, partial [Candidatus Zixiibacteriota bacterium]
APMRGQIVAKNNITFIVDCYNANPDSVKAGLMSFFNTKTDSQRIIILGDMLELGKDSQSYHREIGRLLINKKFDMAFLIGPMTAYIMDEAVKSGMPNNRFIHFDSSQKAVSTVKDCLQPGDIVYVKGSRGIGLEKIINEFDSSEEPS